jgi:REP element-mobilizing transposase RayT
MHLVQTTRFSRRNLPHWEVERGRYFVTVRCAGSLPEEALARVTAIQQKLAEIAPRSASFVAFQRRYFATVEQYLDSARVGPLVDPRAANAVVAELQGLERSEAFVPHFSILPNHWHALIAPHRGSELASVMKTVKGRSARAIRLAIGGTGSVWQREWFDRWIRDDAEWQRCVDYVRNNPVKAGLVRNWHEHAWTQ